MFKARKRISLCIVLAAACTLLAFAPTAGACPGADLTYSVADAEAIGAAVVCLTNVERTSRGLAPLTRESRLASAAADHSRDMATKEYFSHTSKDGAELRDRVERTGYPWSSLGENIAAGQQTARSVMLAWMKSEGHCESILSGSYEEIGVGVAPSSDQYGIYWTQDFGSRSSGGDADASGGCPFSQLAHPPEDSTGGGCAAAAASAPGGLRLTSLRKVSRTRVRVAGKLTASSCCTRVVFRVMRGKRKATTSKQLCSRNFVLRLRAPGGRGTLRVTASVAGSDSKSSISLRKSPR